MKEEIITVLKRYQELPNPRKFGIFIDGYPVYFGGKNVYSSIGIAKRRIIDIVFPCREYASREERYKKRIAALEELISDGKIEIKKL